MATNTSGLSTSFNVQSIVSQLMAVERQPLNKITTDIQSYNTKISAVGKLQSALSSLSDVAKNLKSTAGSFSYNNSDESVGSLVALNTSSNYAIGSYSLTVNSVAQSEKLVSSGFAAKDTTVGTGTLTVDFGKDTGSAFNVNASKTQLNLTIDSSNNTLDGIKQAINNSNSGIKANIIYDGSQYKLSITSPTGENNSLKISTNSTDGLSSLTYDPTGVKNFTKIQNATNAKVNLDGVDIESDTNKISNAIDGFEINAKKIGSTNIDISRDNKALDNVKSFVSKYNDFINTLKTYTNNDVGSTATLHSERGIANLKYQLRDVINTNLNDGTNLQSLNDLGITFDKNGVLNINDSKFNSAMSSNSDKVFKVLDNFNAKLSSFITDTTTTGGLFQNKTQTYNNQIKYLQDKQDTLSTRMDSLEKRYTQEYSRLQQILSENSAIGSSFNGYI